MKKVVFLDVDGTLLDETHKIPESAKKALLEAKKNGHYLVLCTGRTYQIIFKDLLEYFDGVVASAGAHIYWDGKEIFHSCIPRSELKNVSEVLDKHGAFYIFQGDNGRVATEVNKKRFLEFFGAEGRGNVSDSFAKEIIEVPYERDDIESGFYIDSRLTVEEIQKELGNGVKVTGASFGSERTYNGEITMAGVNKATGMQRILDHLGLPKEASIAFGDGPNDFEMIEFANVGVAMGNAIEELKEIANMITDHVSEDGIYNGFAKLNLID